MKLGSLRVFVAGAVIALVLTSCGDDQGPPAPAHERPTAMMEERATAAVDEAALARRYVGEICEPFARYFEDAIQAGFPEFEGVTSLDEVPELFRRLRAISERTHDEFSVVQPPAAIRDIHEQLLTVLETEIAGYQLLETALESGDPELIEEAMVEAEEQATLADFGPTGFFPTGVPQEYEEAWEQECVPRLRQIPGVEQ